MIKIEINEKELKKEEYFEALKPVILERIELVLISLNHINGGKIDVNEGGFYKYKFITRKVINRLSKNSNIKVKEFNKSKYKNTVQTWLTGKGKASIKNNVNFNGIIDLLYALKNNLLKDVLVCEPNFLAIMSNTILNLYGIQDVTNNIILSEVFNYDLPVIGSKIKLFFRSNNFVDYCPYCNITEVRYTSTQKGRTGTSHELDHFFDKGTNPLLACSFFNLIPSDSTCNGDNKGSIHFTDDFHLNPYIQGFNNNIVFVPFLIGQSVKKIELKINALKGSKIRKQILGSSEEINEDNKGKKEHEEGNINVFTIKSKYQDRTEKAQIVLNAIKAKDDGMNVLKKFLLKMNNLDKEEVYLDWYKSKMHTSFEPKKFNKYPFSKFNRDIHDYYYEADTKKRNNFIRDFIK